MKDTFVKKKKGLIVFLNRYIKHATLEIELTLYNGEKLTVRGHRSFDGKNINYFTKKKPMSVSLKEIEQAKVFSI